MKQARSLAERLAKPAPRRAPTDAARARLEKWRSIAGFARLGLWDVRLAEDAVDDASLGALLAEDDASLGARVPAPDWETEIERAFDAGTPTDPDLLARVAEIEEATRRAATRFALPLLLTSWTELKREIRELGDRLPCEPAWLESVFFQQLAERLQIPFTRSIALAVNSARVRGELHAATPELRFAEWVDRTIAQGPRAFFLPCPVLARHVHAIAAAWRSASIRFVRELVLDLPFVAKMFPEPLGKLVAVEGGVGDVHRGGRSVLILTFQNGQKAVYKPHSLAVDAHFAALVTTLNASADRHGILPMLAAEVVDRGDRGYARFLATRACNDEAELTRFFRRQGQLLALMHALEGIDIHSENMLAHGEHPVVIDLEALFHARVHHDAVHDPAARAYGESVLRILFLPSRVSGDNSVGIDISALGDRAGQKSSTPVPLMFRMGTDEMVVQRVRLDIDPNKQRPTLQGADVDVMRFLEPVCEGFETMTRCLIARRDELLADGGAIASFADDEVRIILRDTEVYDRLLTASFHPPFLRDGLERDRIFDYLYQEVRFQPTLANVIAAERRELWAGDIPVFAVRANGTELVSGRGERILGVIGQSGFAQAREKVLALDEAAIARQLWLIRASFATIPLAHGDPSWKTSALRAAHRAPSIDERIARAERIGDRLHALAFESNGRSNWLGLALFGEVEWRLGATDVGFYDGALGIATFLAYLARETGARRHSELAMRAYENVRAHREYRAGLVEADDEGLGGGVASLVFAAPHLASALGRPELLHDAEAVLPRLRALVEKEKALRDVLGGTAATMFACASLYAMSKSALALEVAHAAGRRLASEAIVQGSGIAWAPDFDASRPLAGFSHGASGIGLGLARLGAMIGGAEGTRFRALAEATIRYETSAFSTEASNWYDYRIFEGVESKARTNMATWCHGAAGVGFARAGFRELGIDLGGTVEHDLRIAARTTDRIGFGLNHSICHGDLGNVELLSVAARTLRDEELLSAHDRRLAEIAQSVDEIGISCGVPLGVENAGLFTGISGVGYAWLRAARPDRIPSMLGLEPPRP